MGLATNVSRELVVEEDTSLLQLASHGATGFGLIRFIGRYLHRAVEIHIDIQASVENRRSSQGACSVYTKCLFK